MSDTTRHRIERTFPNACGWVDLRYTAGEPHSNIPTGKCIAAIWHISDLHLCDVDSPGRMEYLDRYSDPDSPLREAVGDVGTYRPQEFLTVQVGLAMFDHVVRSRRAPISERRFDAVLVTGDITDNAQVNELDWYTRIIDGGIIEGGASGRWVGASDPATWDERYWHPEGPPTGISPDLPTSRYGFPTRAGLLPSACEPIMSLGIDLPVISVHGNHDALIQGTIPPSASDASMLTNQHHVIGLRHQPSAEEVRAAVAPQGPACLSEWTQPRLAPVNPRPNRRYLAAGEFARSTGQLGRYGVERVGDLHVIVLDTVNPHGGWQGSVDASQFAWLRDTLSALQGELSILASHHPSFSMTNDYAPIGDRRVLGDDVLALVTSTPGVIAWLTGHIHANHIVKHEGKQGHTLWEISTSSLIDWPQQARIVEFIDAHDEIVIVTTMVDHPTPIEPWGEERLAVANLASISRSLSANDYHDRESGGAAFQWREGRPEMRNVVLRVPRWLPHLDSNQKPFD